MLINPDQSTELSNESCIDWQAYATANAHANRSFSAFRWKNTGFRKQQ
jgi:hypothetical protein